MELKKFPRSKFYSVRVTLPNGQRSWKSTKETNKQEAEKKAKAILAEQEEKRKAIPASNTNSMTLSEAAEKIYGESWSEQRAGEEQYRKVLRLAQLLGDPDLSTIDETTVDTCKKALKRGFKVPEGPEGELVTVKVGNATANRYMAHLKTIMRKAVGSTWKVNCRVPQFTFYKEIPGRIYEIFPEEEQAIFDCLGKANGKAGWRHKDMRDLFTILIDTGMRLSEAIQLHYKGNIDLTNKTILLYADQTKASKGRAVPMTDRVHSILKRRNVLHKVRPFPYSIDECETCWDYVRKALENTDPSFVIHSFRHTYAKRLLRAGVDLYMVSKLLGHSSTKVTERYLQGIVTTDMWNAANKLNAIVSPKEKQAEEQAENSHGQAFATPEVSPSVSPSGLLN